jgi:hypothetical protein
MGLFYKNIIIYAILLNLINSSFFQNDSNMYSSIDHITMSFQVVDKPDELIINYSVINSSDKDIYLTDVIINFQNGKPNVNRSLINCLWIKSKGFILLSNICKPLPEGISMLTPPTHYVTKISAESTYSNNIILKTPVLTIDLPSGLFSPKTANGIRLEFGYSFYDESLNLKPAEELGNSIFIANYSLLGLQQILTAELEGLSIPCQKW